MSFLEEQLAQVVTSKRWMLSRIQDIKNSPDGAKSWLRDLGKNDFEHAEAVEEYVGKILSESGTKLCPEEIYLLLHAIYTHDIGYREGAQKHALASHDMIIQHPESFFIKDENLATAIAWIVLAYGMDGLAEVPSSFSIDFLNKTKEFDLRFLGALLLLADEMDQGYLRVFNRAGQKASIRNSVYHVDIGSQIIKLKTKPLSREQWEELRSTASYIQKRLEGILGILNARGVRLEQVSLYPMSWAEEGGRHEDIKPSEKPACAKHKGGDLLFLLDETVLAAQVLQHAQLESWSLTVVPISAMHISEYPFPDHRKYSVIIWMLGEDFEKPVVERFLDFILSNTANGGGLVLFPFVAWSVSQGINERIQEALPVTLENGWSEGRNQRVSVFKSHMITTGLKPFDIQNTYEWLTVKQNAQSIVADVENQPFITVGMFGKGRVVYVNVSSHLCQEARTMVSPWQQSFFIKDIIDRTIAWVSRE